MDLDEIEQLRILLDNASRRLDKAVAEVNQSQIDVAIGRTAYFDRLTIGSGAVIAAMISFLGTHLSTLHPEWLLRCSLVSLTLTMLAGLYRSFRYPYYIMQVRKVSWIEAERNHQQIRHKQGLAIGPPADIVAKMVEGYGASDAKLDTVVKGCIKKRERSLKECHWAEAACLFAVGVAMVSLVWLALCTF